ncbi:MAG: 6-bladed beta-propeller [Staphylococcus sp.]|nr:6-bladed beta-propeller [Staphylococcus sp.]
MTEGIISYDVSEENEGGISSVFSGVELIPLQFSGESYPSVVRSVLVADGKIFVLDDKAILHVFKDNGEYVASSYEKFGNGPGEYSILTGFTWNPYFKAIEILTPDKLLSFDEGFNLLKEAKLPTKVGKDNLLYDEVFDLSETRHLLHTSSLSVAPYRIDLFDSAKEEVIDSKSYIEDVQVRTTMQTRSFFTMPDNTTVFTSHAITDAVYGFHGLDENDKIDDNMMKIFTIHANNEITADDINPYSSDLRKEAEYVLNTNKSVRLRILPNSKRLFVLYKNGTSMKSMLTTVIDRGSGEHFNIKLYQDGEYSFPLIQDIDEEYAYAAIEKVDLESNPKLLTDKAENIGSLLNGIDDESLIVLRYKIR